MDFQASTRHAVKPALVSKMIIWLATFSLAQASRSNPDRIDLDMALKLLDWGDAQVDTPHWAILSDSYAAAHVSSPSPSPIVSTSQHVRLPKHDPLPP